MTGTYLLNDGGQHGREQGGKLRSVKDRRPILFGMLLGLIMCCYACADRGKGAGRDQGQVPTPDPGQGQVQHQGGSFMDSVGDNAGSLYASGLAVLKAVRLPDGTEVVMHGGTRVRISKTYGQKDRELWMEGEAMFDVENDSGKSFIIHTPNLQIIVTALMSGTRFRVDAKAGQAGEEADVLSGRLKVMKSYHSDTDNEPELIGAGQMVMINRDIDLMEKEKMDGSELKGWDAGH